MRKKICIISLFLSCIISSYSCFSQCTAITVGSIATNVTQTSAKINFQCCQAGTYYIEYGLSGFTPGTAGTAGAGGTLLNIPTNASNYTLSGLTPNTAYDAYVRRNCSGTIWSPNSPKVDFATAPDCGTAPTITCSTFYTFNPPLGPGAWSGNTCGSFNTSMGREVIYSFTPTVSGTHVLFQQPTSGNSNVAAFFYKAASAGCTEANWTCIGPAWQTSVNQYSFGPLTAGTQYYILADEYSDAGAPIPTTFRIECSYCAQPTNATVTSSTPSSINISWSGNASILEYGPHNFIPGTGTGTTVGVFGNSATVTNLSPATSYDIYLRYNCGGNYSPHSNVLWASTLPCPAFGTYPTLGTWYGLYSSTTGMYNYYLGCGGITFGEESYFTFVPPSSGYYTVALSYGNSYYNFLTRPHSANCDVSTFSCMSPSSFSTGVDYFTWGPLTAGTTYDMLFDVSDTVFNGFPTVNFMVSCPSPSSIVANNFQPNSASFTWNCNCPASTYLEYGPTGFTPGTGVAAGTNGTLVSNVSSPYTLTGLASNTPYDVYLRSACGGNFSLNTTVTKIWTAVDCSTAPVLNCGDFFTYNGPHYNGGGGLSGTLGAWTQYGPNQEKIWRFTPTVSGNHIILVYGGGASSYGYSYTGKFYYKTQSSGCNDAGWALIGTATSNATPTNQFPPFSFTLPSLTAGTTYLIMVDGSPCFWQSYNFFARLDCPNVCSVPKLYYATSITQNSASILNYCNTCFGNLILEYGPAGFIPGTGAAAGTNGTVAAVSTFPYNLTGLNTGTTYDVYARTNCGAGGYSANCTKITFTTTGCVAAVTPGGTVNFCAGSSLNLTANTGTGISYQWYKNGVAQAGATSSSYLIGNAGTYYVVETSSCGTATSNSVVVNQINNPNPVVTYATPTTFCSPGNILFTANTFAGVTYQWQKNSVDIAGATAQTYLATTNGKYRVKETANGCTKQGTDVQVSTATSVTATIAANGPVTFCTGGSVVLSVSNAIPGYSYQWKNNGVNIAGAITSSYTATTAGSYTCTVSASCGSATSNAIVVSTGGIVALVNPSGTVNICNGATVSFSANTGAGYAYQWKKNGTNISGATSANYSATTAGSYTVAITSPCGNATSAATTVAITALTASITPTGTTTICNGSAATFTANTGYNYTYQWYRAGLAIAGATASTHANSTAGNYTVVITQGGVCFATSNIAILAVTNNPNPSVTAGGPTTFCVGQSVTLTANTFAGATYQWTKNGTNIAGATNQSYIATTAGQYSVKETANGCTKQLGVPIVVTVNCRSAFAEAMADEEGIKLMPNPTSGKVKLEIGSQKTERVGVRVYDVLGKEVFTTEFNNTEETNAHEMDLSNLKSGIYFMQVTTLTEKKTLKIIKQ